MQATRSMQLEAIEGHWKVLTLRLGHLPEHDDNLRVPEKINVSKGQRIPFYPRWKLTFKFKKKQHFFGPVDNDTDYWGK